MPSLYRLAFLLAVAGSIGLSPPDDPEEALGTISARDIRAHLRFLSHDLLEGRAPATRGGETAALYIASQFERVGLEPVEGSYRQPVPLTGSAVDLERLSLTFEVDGRRIPADYPADAIVWAGARDTAVAIEGEVVFVGYGVDAPEQGWNDFKGEDLKGKVLLFLINDPPAPPEEPDRFGGLEMTYYGRWSYKFEEAARRGAAGALIIHSTDQAGYGWNVVESSWTGEQLALRRDPATQPDVAVQGWIDGSFARRMLEEAGLSLAELVVLAARRDFRPVATGMTLDARIRSRVRPLATANVVGYLPGASVDRRDELIVYTAHYDHLGIGAPVDGDSIYNGAYDNASGVALLIEVAEAFAALEPGPDRSILFIATAAEEAGLLGATHYTRHPAFPLAGTVAVINIDGANVWGETEDMVVMGAERSTLGRVVADRVQEMGLRLTPEPVPEKGLYFRSDHFPFARAGIPAIAIQHGLAFKGRDARWIAKYPERYDRDHYHRPSDEYRETFDLAGAVQQARLAFLVGYDLTRAPSVPEWYEGRGFGPARDRSGRSGTAVFDGGASTVMAQPAAAHPTPAYPAPARPVPAYPARAYLAPARPAVAHQATTHPAAAQRTPTRPTAPHPPPWRPPDAPHSDS